MNHYWFSAPAPPQGRGREIEIPITRDSRGTSSHVKANLSARVVLLYRASCIIKKPCVKGNLVIKTIVSMGKGELGAYSL